MPTTTIAKPADLAALRPVDGTAAAIGAALDSARAALADHQGAEAAAKAERDRLLLDGTPAELKQAEAALADVRATLERVAAISTTLSMRHAVAMRAETVAGLDTLRATAELAYANLDECWRRTKPEVFAAMEEMRRLKAVAGNAIREFDNRGRVVASRYPDLTIQHPDVQHLDHNPVYEVKSAAMVDDFSRGEVPG